MMARPQWILSQEQFRLQAGNSLLVRTSAMIHTTPPSQGGGTGSNPVGAANSLLGSVSSSTLSASSMVLTYSLITTFA